MRSYSLLLTTLIFCSCASLNTEKSASFDQIQKFKINQSNKKDVAGVLGEAPLQIKSGDSEIWLYYYKNSRRQKMNLAFNSDETLKSITWFVQANDSESNLNILLAKYGVNQFSKHSIQWQESDLLQNQTYLSNNKLGMSIDIDSKERVTLINWSQPGSVSEKDGLIAPPTSETSKVLVDRLGILGAVIQAKK